MTASNASTSYLFHTFSTSTLNKGLAESSKTDFLKLGVVLAIVALYGWVAQSVMAVLSVLLLASSVAAGLGFCSLLGLPMNLLSTHVLPFISVGLAMRETFLLLSTQSRNLTPPEVLQRSGPVILTAAFAHATAFLAAAVVPVPALRIFCFQSAVLVAFHTATTLLVLPALLALQTRCKKSAVPCIKADHKTLPATQTNNNNDPVSAFSYSMLSFTIYLGKSLKACQKVEIPSNLINDITATAGPIYASS